MTTTIIGRSALAGLAAAALACGGSPAGFSGDGSPRGSDSGADATSPVNGDGDDVDSGAGGTSTFNGGEGGSGGGCRTGIYSGTFSCLFYYQVDAGIGSAPDSGGIGPITGTLSFLLSQSFSNGGESAPTETASGTFDATTGLFIAASANLTGMLQCAASTFSGELVDGLYGFNLDGMPAPDPNNMFQGPLISGYDSKSSSFVDGQWSMEIAGYGPCIGTWTASYQGPADGGAADAGPADAGGQ